MAIDEHDGRRGRCRMLGHEVPFKYCRELNEGRPCRKILDCWFEIFDVQAFLGDHYSEAEMAEVLQPAKPKMVSLVELIEQARERQRRNKG